MFELKIILTVVATLVLLAGFLGTNETVTGFFDSVGGRFSLSSGARSIDFTLTADNYSDMQFSGENFVNITVDGDTTALLRTGNLRTNKTLSVYGFRGTGEIAGGTLTLNGNIVKIGLPEIAVAVQETITSTSNFSSFSAVNLELDRLVVHGAGSVTVRNSTTQFTGEIEITAPVGTFEINRNNRTFFVSGSASKIVIPGSGINIG